MDAVRKVYKPHLSHLYFEKSLRSHPGELILIEGEHSDNQNPDDGTLWKVG